jgi:hypothetical protein
MEARIGELQRRIDANEAALAAAREAHADSLERASALKVSLVFATRLGRGRDLCMSSAGAVTSLWHRIVGMNSLAWLTWSPSAQVGTKTT